MGYTIARGGEREGFLKCSLTLSEAWRPAHPYAAQIRRFFLECMELDARFPGYASLWSRAGRRRIESTPGEWAAYM